MKILGISAFHRDAAAVLLVDGDLVAAAQEERFTKQPLDAEFPSHAIRYCLRHAGVRSNDLDFAVFYEKPLRKFERVLATQMQAFPRSGRSFAHSAFTWLGDRLWVKNRIAKELGVGFEQILFTPHQQALAANAFFTSPFEESALLTIDDVGEWATATLGSGAGRTIETEREVLFPHSLGLVVSAFTQFLGFTPGHDEARIEYLAAYGEPRHADALRALLPLTADGFTVDQTLFRFAFDSDRLYSDALAERFGPARSPGDPLLYEASDTRHADLAASLQLVVEERVLALAAALHEQTPSANLCVAGELANNTGVIRRLVAESRFRNLHVPHAAGKAGGALGAALLVFAEKEKGHWPSFDPRLGEAIDDRAEDDAHRLGGRPEDEVARRLLLGELVGWARGRMEFGAESFGNRSILADASVPDARHALLSAVQRVEPYLPCRLAIPAERAADLLEFDASARDLVARGRLRVPARRELRDAAPSAIDPDGSVRVHLVDASIDPALHSVLTQIGATRPAPIALLADFALRGSSIPRREPDAVAAFRRSQLHCLVVDDRVYE